MIRVTLLSLSLLLLASCGVQRPLVAPKDIPAHEERLRRKHERLEETPVTVIEQPAAPDAPMTNNDTPISPSEFPATGGKAN